MHPYYFSAFPIYCEGDIEADLKEADEAFCTAIGQQQWEQAVDLIEGWRYRFRYLNELIEPRIPSDPLSDKRYWKLVRKIIRDSTNHFNQESDIITSLENPRTQKIETLNGEDHDAFLELNAELTGWRGVCASDCVQAEEAVKSGFSWTVDRGKAENFAKRMMEHDGVPFIARATFKKENIEAYFPSLGEGEFLVRVLSLSKFAESFGRTVMEAMAAGRPVVCYDRGAPPYLVESGKSGLVVPADQPQGVANALLALDGHATS